MAISDGCAGTQRREREVVITISCIVCHTQMRIEWQEYHDYAFDEILVAVECECGRALGSLRPHYLRREGNAYASSDLSPVDPNRLGEAGKETIKRAQELMLRGERYVSAATWVRDRP
jgi:hypothetical protein